MSHTAVAAAYRMVAGRVVPGRLMARRAVAGCAVMDRVVPCRGVATVAVHALVVVMCDLVVNATSVLVRAFVNTLAVVHTLVMLVVRPFAPVPVKAFVSVHVVLAALVVQALAPVDVVEPVLVM